MKLFGRKAGRSNSSRGNSHGNSRVSTNPRSFRQRSVFVGALLALAASGLVYRAVGLQFTDRGFLQSQGDARFSRVTEITAHRGSVTDRYGEPLAISTPVDSIWVNPKELALATEQIPRLARELHQDKTDIARRITSNLDREFLYLARHMQPADAARIKQLDIPGVYATREYRRYYPAGEVTGHVLGFTNVDDNGQEGLELAFDHWLAGEDGAKRVIQDRMGRTVQDVDAIRAARPGRDLVLSIDQRIQYLAYRELKSAMQTQRAKSGSVVVLDVSTGEVLAMVNQPTFNPNDREQLKPGGYRNRAATDLIEPGSSFKPFIAAAGIAAGKYDERSIIDTSPGMYKVGIKVIEDPRNYGLINIATVLAKSSNVGMARLALTLEPEQIYSTLTRLGFGQVTTSGYPGESAGLLSHYSHWRPIGIATLAYGYGVSVTPLQLAHAYATIGAMGISRPVSFLRVDGPVAGERVLDENVASTLVHMLESVILPSGTGIRAAIPGYRVAGKTGTAWKSNQGGYSTDKYVAVFAGLAPATNPRLATVVVIDEPGAGLYHGGDVAAPVFANLVGGALRMLAIAPDAPINPPLEEMPSSDATPTVATLPSATAVQRR